jgi:RNA polymerase sigma-70 factor (ECF subfamily)
VQAWLFRIATNTAYDYLRRQRRVRFIALDATPTPSIDDHELAARLDAASTVTQALRRIRPRHRILLLLHYYADRSIPDIAALLACPRATINTRLFRARAQLRQALQNHDTLDG